MKKMVRKYIVLVLVAALVAGGIYYWLLPWLVRQHGGVFSAYTMAADETLFYVKIAMERNLPKSFKTPKSAKLWRIDKLFGVVPYRVFIDEIKAEDGYDILEDLRNKTFVEVVQLNPNSTTYSFMGRQFIVYSATRKITGGA